MSRLPYLLIALSCVILGGASPRPDLFEIDLVAANPASSFVGKAVLVRPPSPFGLAVTRDGHFIYQARISTGPLPHPSAFGPYDRYVVWAATPNLDQVTRLGELEGEQVVVGRVAYNKFMILVTAEPGAGGERWAGAIVLIGRSASSLLASFSSHTMFNGGMPQ